MAYYTSHGFSFGFSNGFARATISTMDQKIDVCSRQAVELLWLTCPVGHDGEHDALVSAGVVALGTDALARPDDTLPDIGSDDRRGWWADLDAETIWGAWPIGSRLWLLSRAKITDAAAKQGPTVERARAYALEALQPLVTAGIASEVDVEATRTALGRIDVTATIYRGPLPAVQLQWQDLWNRIGA